MSFLNLMQQDTAEKPARKSPIIFVASDATHIEITDAEPSQDHIIRNGKYYRRLTPKYWAWFNHKYNLMEKALTRGKISEAAFKEILDRISALYNHAVALFGKEALDEACRAANVKELDEIIRRENQKAMGREKTGVPSLVAEREVRPARKNAGPPRAPAQNPAVEKVDAIRDRATALGWTRDQLYRTDGIAYRDWGLVRFLGADDEIGEITQKYIEVINKKKGCKHRFYNQNTDQPWISKCDARGESTDAVQKCG